MKKHWLIIVAATLLGLALAGFVLNPSPRADALEATNPTIIAIDPASAFNDLATTAVINGSGFAAEVTGTLVLTAPSAYLGDTPLADVTWVSSTTLTATVPWHLEAGVYTLTVTNPDGGTGLLTQAFTVTQGVGEWNNGALYGGEVRQVMLKPGDPNTVYARAFGVGLFRSQDAGESWRVIRNDLHGNSYSVLDPLHPTWVYTADDSAVFRSVDEGDTWTTLVDIWPDGTPLDIGRIYPSPHNAQVIFVSSCTYPGLPSTGALGLMQSSDGGMSWTVVADLAGVTVQDVAYHPTDPLQMVLGTQTGQVYKSTDGGGHWSEVVKPPISYVGSITYNPYRPSEVWVTFGWNTGLYKTTAPGFTAWQDVTPSPVWVTDLWFLKFAGPDSIYTVRQHSADGGLTWQPFGEWNSYGEVGLNPADPQVIYIGDNTYGIQKSINGGQTWEVKNQGLSGMRALQIHASELDPRRVYATFSQWPGVFRSDDAANSWTYFPLPPGAINVRVVREDPFNLQRLFLAADSGYYTSTTQGQSWVGGGWNVPPGAEVGGPNAMEADPYNPGHLLVGFQIHGDDYNNALRGRLYSSTDYGQNWTPVSVAGADIAWISDIAFHPDIPGLVFLSTGGSGLYRSTDSGSTWERIDDPTLYWMQWTGSITLATHPQNVLLVAVGNTPYRSYDNGDTWMLGTSPCQNGGSSYMFLSQDTNRLYAATLEGMYLSSTAGDSWIRADGMLGRVHITAMGYADAGNYTILYAATTGGDLSQAASLGLSTGSSLVEAGVYRYVSQSRYVFLPLVQFEQ